MNIFIQTQNTHKKEELSKYFTQIGLTPILTEEMEVNQHSNPEDYVWVREKTSLIRKKDQQPCTSEKEFEEVIHRSELQVQWKINGEQQKRMFQAEVEGLLCPSLKTNRQDVYNWDDIFVSLAHMKTYQELKDKGLKVSARDLCMNQFIETLPELFRLKQRPNLNFNPVQNEQVISFEPVIQTLIKKNPYYQMVMSNDFFRPLMNSIVNQGLFTRRAMNRQQKNYWLPGLNAGLPLTPKSNELHELTFMFHDLMHFLFPDVMVLDDQEKSREIYILSRMMSEAFTLVLADMMFIQLIKQHQVEYDYSQRKIFPLIEKETWSVNRQHWPDIQEWLWANVCFALLGEDELLRKKASSKEAFEAYESKYGVFFREDYLWTHHNYQQIKQQCKETKNWEAWLSSVGVHIPHTQNFCPHYPEQGTLKEKTRALFESMIQTMQEKLEKDEPWIEEKGFTQAVKKYIAGQVYIFFEYDLPYNALFLNEIRGLLQKENLDSKDLEQWHRIYGAYLNKLQKDQLITPSEAQNYHTIYPLFDPYYVFYNRHQEKALTLKETVKQLWKI